MDKRLKLSAADVVAIRRRYANRSKQRVTQAQLARLYNVSATQINWIVLGRSRADVSGPRSFAFAGHDLSTRASGQFNGGAKLSARQVRRIRALYAAKSPRITQAALAERYGVSAVCICLLVNGKTWRNGA